MCEVKYKNNKEKFKLKLELNRIYNRVIDVRI